MLRRLFNRLLGKPAWGPIPVLCYHSWTVNGSDYASNDHEALKQDLQTLARKGYEVRQRENRKADFHAVDNPEDAERQIAAAQDYINQVTDGRTVPVFCYPYGHVSEYVRDHYLPSHGGRLGLRAAFSTAGASVTEASNIWALPRFVCGWHWRSPEEFSTLLKDVARSRR